MKEIWKDVLGYEGLYQVNNCGNVKSLSRTITKGNITYVTKDRILKQSVDSVGYPYVNLSDYKKQKTFRVHQLIAVVDPQSLTYAGKYLLPHHSLELGNLDQYKNLLYQPSE